MEVKYFITLLPTNVNINQTGNKKKKEENNCIRNLKYLWSSGIHNENIVLPKKKKKNIEFLLCSLKVLNNFFFLSESKKFH